MITLKKRGAPRRVDDEAAQELASECVQVEHVDYKERAITVALAVTFPFERAAKLPASMLAEYSLILHLPIGRLTLD